tara:strand:- start:236 stop:799 length:564 start_codon:yes stop_codon:yes gene_type:complete
MIGLMKSLLKSFQSMKGNLNNIDLVEFKKGFANKKEAPEIKRLALCASKMCAKSEELRKLHEEDIKVKKQLRKKMTTVKTVEEIMKYAKEGLKHERNMKKLRTDTKYLKCQMQKCAKHVHALEQKKKMIVGNTKKAIEMQLELKNAVENQGFKNFLSKSLKDGTFKKYLKMRKNGKSNFRELFKNKI